MQNCNTHGALLDSDGLCTKCLIENLEHQAPEIAQAQVEFFRELQDEIQGD